MDAAPQSAAGADPLVGRVLAGSYRLEALLGRGAMGRVYRAAHTLIPQAFAVKVLHPELAEDEDLRKRFLQEARALMLFAHRNVVPVRHCGEDGGLVFLAMDLCRGETLEAVMARAGALSEPRAIAIARQVLDALAEAHREGIVHRDLKPANVMIETSAEGRESVRVLDFGLARILTAGRDAAAASRVSSLGEVVGTVAYMSPEQAMGADLDGRSDLFSLGVMLFEMVEGRHPFLGGTMASVITRLLEVEPLAAAPDVPRKAGEGLQRVLGHALQKDLARRFPDAAAFARALDDLSAGREVEKPHDPRAEARRARRRRSALAGVAALALLGGGAFALSRLMGGDAPTRQGMTSADAQAALARGDWRAAALALEGPAAAGTASAEERLSLARARVELRDPDADRDLHALERLLPDDPRVAVLRGRYWHRIKGDPERALASLASALAKDRRSVEAREARLDLLLDGAHAEWFAGRRANRFTQAADDVAALEAASAPASRVALARSRLEFAAAQQPGADLAAGLERAAAAASEAAAADRRSADGPEQQALVVLRQAGEARLGRRPADALSLGRAGVVLAGEALARLLASPTHRAQGGREVALRRLRLNAAMHVADDDVITAEVKALQRLEPADQASLLDRAYGLRTAGRFEEAVPVYETLREIAPDGAVLGDLAFCHQRIALGRLQQGEREAGLASLERALKIYGEALGHSAIPVLLAYRGETRGFLARWDPARRAEHLEAARRDLDQAMAAASFSERDEVLFRRSGVRFQSGDLEGAHADIAAAVAEKPAMNPAFHGRMARTALALAVKQVLAGASGAPWRDLALAQAGEAEVRSGEQVGSARLIQAQTRLLTGGPADAAAAVADIDAALAPKALPDGDLVVEARLWRLLAEALSGASGAEASALLETRRRELVMGRDVPTAAFDEGLARLVSAVGGDPDLAARARDLASRRPPE